MEALELAGVATRAVPAAADAADIAASPRPGGRHGGLQPHWSRRMDGRGAAGRPSGLWPLGARAFHYKVCSTFDSSPTVGSIGRAIEIARTADRDGYPDGHRLPALGRYCVFGDLYARAAGTVRRLDRHPSLPGHPVTPMQEADLLRHLRAQTALSATSIDVLALDGPWEDLVARHEDAMQDADFILFDILRDGHLARIGKLIWSGPDGPPPS